MVLMVGGRVVPEGSSDHTAIVTTAVAAVADDEEEESLQVVDVEAQVIDSTQTEEGVEDNNRSSATTKPSHAKELPLNRKRKKNEKNQGDDSNAGDTNGKKRKTDHQEKIEKLWQDKYEELKGYLNSPTRDYSSNVALAKWVTRQRTLFKKKQLREDRAQKLLEIGILKEETAEATGAVTRSTGIHQTDKWNLKYEELQAFKAKHGHCRVPYRNKTYTKLAVWVRAQRVAFKKKQLAQDRRERLEQVGFAWEAHAEKVDQAIPKLQAWFELYGDFKVPNTFVTRDGIALGNFVSSCHSDNRKGRLGKDRKEQLDAIGFFDDTDDSEDQKRWNTQFEQLQAYKEEHGDCLVPKQYDKNPALSRWVAAMRRKYKKKELPQEQIDLLQDADFVWDTDSTNQSETAGISNANANANAVHEENWNRRFAELKEYIAKHGDCLVPTHSSSKEHYALGSWVATQRCMYRKKQLQDHPRRLQKLQGVGFVWDVNAWNQQHTDHWEERYAELKDCKNQNRSVNENPKLSDWVVHQRWLFKRKKLGKKREEKLRDANFDFSPSVNNPDSKELSQLAEAAEAQEVGEMESLVPTNGGGCKTTGLDEEEDEQETVKKENPDSVVV